MGYLSDHSFMPDDGEVFVLQWRVLVEETLDTDEYDASIGAKIPDAVAYVQLGDDTIYYSTADHKDAYAVSPGVWHEYELRSADLQSYELLVDGWYAVSGDFHWGSWEADEITFGDTVIGARSLSRWDYVRFGVVPEPGAAALCLATAIVSASYQRRRRQP